MFGAFYYEYKRLFTLRLRRKSHTIVLIFVEFTVYKPYIHTLIWRNVKDFDSY